MAGEHNSGRKPQHSVRSQSGVAAAALQSLRPEDHDGKRCGIAVNAFSRRCVWIPCFTLALSLAPLLSAAHGDDGSTSRPAVVSAAPLDEAAFREGLRQRGLTTWLQQYLQENPPADAADAALRRREALLRQAQQVDVPPRQRRQLISEAGDILRSLLAENSQHPSRLQWRLKLAEDLLERVDPGALDAVLLFELPGLNRITATGLSVQAVEQLRLLRQEISAAWQAMESLDEAAVEEVGRRGGFRELESLDSRSALLLCWGRLYAALAAETPSKEELGAILSEVTDRGWMQLPTGQEGPRCSALLIAAVASRYTGQFESAGRFARQATEALKSIPAARRERFRNLALLGVLEQIRIVRDAGKLEEALAAVDQAREWAGRTRAEDVSAAIAVALAEVHVIVRGRTSPTTQPANIFAVQGALAPLERLAARPPADRDALYRALAGAVNEGPLPGQSAFALQLIAGAAVMQAIASENAPAPADRKRIGDLAGVLESTVASVPNSLSPETAGEIRFLSGRAHQLARRMGPAVEAFMKLAERSPGHDRAASAVEYATAAATEWLQQADSREAPAARQGFIQATTLRITRDPDSPATASLRYPLALALEQDGQLAAAASAYAAVREKDPRYLSAALGRARSLRNALAQATATSAPSDELTQQAMQAAQQAVTLAAAGPSASPESRCLAAEIVLNLVGLLNSTHKSQTSLDVLERFEERFSPCPGALGKALEERVTALRQLQRLSEAREVASRLLRIDPKHAGPVMARLLEGMRSEAKAAIDRGEGAVLTGVATEAAALAQALLDWSRDHPGSIPPAEEVTIKIWQAWSLFESGRGAEALAIFTACEALGPESLPPDSAARVETRLGQAECLLSGGKADRALPIFTELWRRLPEHCEAWWHALVGSLQCHRQLGSDNQQILQTIRQQRRLAPDLGGPRWKRALETLEDRIAASGSRPAR